MNVRRALLHSKGALSGRNWVDRWRPQEAFDEWRLVYRKVSAWRQSMAAILKRRPPPDRHSRHVRQHGKLGHIGQCARSQIIDHALIQRYAIVGIDLVHGKCMTIANHGRPCPCAEESRAQKNDRSNERDGLAMHTGSEYSD